MLAPFLPSIPNLEFGFLYSFGPNLRISSGRFTADYLFPVDVRCDSAFFGEAHVESEFYEFLGGRRVVTTAGKGFVTTSTAVDNRTDLSLGGGYRRLLRGCTLLGVNAFYDTSRLWAKWYSSGGVGLELLSNVTDNDAVDLRANWYGNLFSRDLFVNAFRNKGGGFDVQAGYSRGIFWQALDLRLEFTGYQFDIGEMNAVNGYRAGAELTTRDGVLTARYEHGYDRINGPYDTVGGFVTLGFQFDKILRWESPVTMPEPIFVNPRNLRRWLSQKVRRNWHQPTAVVLTRQGQGGCGNLDRFFAGLAISTGPLYNSGSVPFSAVPHTCLEPTRFIVVEFDYAFDAAPTGGTAFWGVNVTDSIHSAVNQFFGHVPTAQSGHLSLTLDTLGIPPANSQSAFTDTSVDPNHIFLESNAAGTSTLTITNVAIHFNH